MKKILFFAHYYAPDTASTAQILTDLAEGMSSVFDVTVICVVPSYTGSVDENYKTGKYYYEELNGVKIIRIRVPEFDKTRKLSRLKNILAYFFGAVKACRKSGKQDYIITISQPPILGGLLGVIGKWLKKAKMIYSIQDFNPEQIMAVGYSKNKALLKVMMALDKLSCKKSDLVITVGCDLAETLKKRFKGGNIPKYVVINNWIDESKVFPLPSNDENVLSFKRKYGLDGKFVIMYSGNIGLYYDLENLIKVFAKFPPGAKSKEGQDVVFAFVGAGSILDKLKENSAENVLFIPYQDKQNLIYSLNSASVHLCTNAKGIKGVSCPSKAYGIMAVGKPIIGVLEKNTEIRNLIEKCNCGFCCEPGDYQEIERIIRLCIESDELEKMGYRGRQYLEENLTSQSSIQKYINAVESL